LKLNTASFEIYGAIYFISINQFMGNFMNTILVFQNERPVFLREQANKMYGVFSYFVAKVTMDTPVLIIAPLIFSMITYWSLGMEYTFEQYAKFFLAVTMTCQAAASLGYLISSIFEN